MAAASTLDSTFRALADPTRRAVVQALGRGPATVSTLKPFDMALPSFLQHLKVLEDSGLVSTSKAGRVRTCALRSPPLAEAQDWLEAQRALWTRRLDQLDALLFSLKNEEEPPMNTFTTDVFDPALDLELRREVDVPPRLVWRAWTEPALLMQWFTPAPWRTTACEVVLQPGGTFRTVMEGPNGEKHDNIGCVLAVVPEQFLLFTDALGAGHRPLGKGFMTASVHLRPTEKGTLYVARALHKDAADKNTHEQMGFHQGWGTALDQLVALAKRL